MHETNKYKITVAYTLDGMPIIEEVFAESYIFTLKNYFCLSFYDEDGRLVKEYFTPVISLEPVEMDRV